ncbi:MAG: AraC family transcriptional regulator [Bacteroidales bacterium]|nr:AraC family transcriptional regulator [Bacteroidales bacterium]
MSIVLYIDFFVRSAAEKVELLNNPTSYYKVLEIILHEVISLQGIIYSILAILLISKYQAKIKDYVSSAQKSIIKILYIGISLNLLSWTMGIIDVHLRYFNIELGIDLFAVTYLILVLVIYAISYAALKSPEIFKLELSSEKSHSLDFRSLVRGSKESGKTKLSQASDETISGQSTAFDPGLKKLNQQLIDFMEKQKPYLNPELSLPALAQELDQPRNQLSSVINQVHQKNFYEFVNEYRVDEVKQLMTDPANKHLKLISLAYDAGFNSKASFNRIFKQMTNLTPSQYVSEQKSV